MIAFKVLGTPLPKGSMRPFIPKGWTRPILTSTTKGLKAWEHQIAAVAQAMARETLLTEPLLVRIDFYFSRPKSLPKRIQDHAKRPDLDKLIRGATDALTGVIWKDDAQITELQARKFYTKTESDPPRAEFQIQELH